MIDHIIRYASEKEAKLDKAMAPYLSATEEGGFAWRADICIPGASVWQPTDDTTDKNGVVTHQPLPGWFIVVSLPATNLALKDSVACSLVVDREAAKRSEAYKVKSPVIELAFEPTFAGSRYAFG